MLVNHHFQMTVISYLQNRTFVHLHIEKLEFKYAWISTHLLNSLRMVCVYAFKTNGQLAYEIAFNYSNLTNYACCIDFLLPWRCSDGHSCPRQAPEVSLTLSRTNVFCVHGLLLQSFCVSHYLLTSYSIYCYLLQKRHNNLINSPRTRCKFSHYCLLSSSILTLNG